MKVRFCVVTVALALLSLSTVAQADVFKMGPELANLETVLVGNAGNVGELSGGSIPGGFGPDKICGAVDYKYHIGKYEVTTAQYTDFLNYKAKTDTYGLYDYNMWSNIYGCKIQRSGTSGDYVYSVAPDWANRPVNYVSYWDACRFANWLHNGQGDGDTETGAYTLNGYTGYDGRWIQRNPGAKWAISSENEWYKAAYYNKKGGKNAGYWDYATQSNELPYNSLTYPDGGNNANFNRGGYTIGSPYYLTNVGEFEKSESAYGTFDQSGNVWEWNEALVVDSGRSVRGAAFDNIYELPASVHTYVYPANNLYGVGFRVVSLKTIPGNHRSMPVQKGRYDY